MLEVSLALIITAFAVAGTIKASIQTQKLELAGIQGDGLSIARGAGEAYSQENYTLLQKGSPVSKNGITLNPGTALGQSYRPTVANLLAMGYLPTGFSVDGSFSNGQAPGTYQFKLDRTPAGCELITNGASCDVGGLVYLDKPIVAAGSTEPDGPAMSAIASKIGGNAGFTMLPQPSQLSGMGGAWTAANPLAGNPAGVVAARFGFGSSGLNNFVRLNDTRDPNLQGDLSVAGTITGRDDVGTSDGVTACLRAALQTDGQIVAKATNCLVRGYIDPNTATIGVTNAAGATSAAMDGNTGTITASGSVSGKLLNASTLALPGDACALENDIANTGPMASAAGLLVCRGNVWRNPAMVTSTPGSICSINGGIAVNSANQETLLCQSGRYVSLNQLIKTAVAGDPCPTDTAMAQTTSGAALICQSGTWTNIVDRMGKFAFQAATMVTVSTTSQGAWVAAPTCYANGVPKIYLIPKSEEQIGYINHFATGSGPWNVYVQDGEGNAVKGIMIAQTYCYYL